MTLCVLQYAAHYVHVFAVRELRTCQIVSAESVAESNGIISGLPFGSRCFLRLPFGKIFRLPFDIPVYSGGIFIVIEGID